MFALHGVDCHGGRPEPLRNKGNRQHFCYYATVAINYKCKRNTYYVGAEGANRCYHHENLNWEFATVIGGDAASLLMTAIFSLNLELEINMVSSLLVTFT